MEIVTRLEELIFDLLKGVSHLAPENAVVAAFSNGQIDSDTKNRLMTMFGVFFEMASDVEKIEIRLKREPSQMTEKELWSLNKMTLYLEVKHGEDVAAVLHERIGRLRGMEGKSVKSSYEL